MKITKHIRPSEKTAVHLKK